MAIDSAEKRQNLGVVARPYKRAHFPIATPDEEWRIATGNAYGGNALSAVGEVLIAQSRAALRFVFSRVFGRVN